MSQDSEKFTNSVSFGQAIKLFFKNYADFEGRASRSEYWWAFLFNFLVSSVLSFFLLLGVIYSVGVLVATLSISIRRLHDTGREWYYILFGLIPLAGPIILLVWYCQESDTDNRWGPRLRNQMTNSGDSQEAFDQTWSYTAEPQEAEPQRVETQRTILPKTDMIQKEPSQTATARLFSTDPALANPTVIMDFLCEGKHQRVQLREFPCLIGRDASAVQVPVPDINVSRVHARIYIKNSSEVYIEDMNSSNGTKVNGEFISVPTELLSGDEVMIGSTKIMMEVGG